VNISTVTSRAIEPACAPNRHTDADFAAPLHHRVVEHAIQSEGREQQRDPGEEKPEHRQQALAQGLRADQIRLCADVTDAKFRARPWHFPAQHGGQRHGVLGGRAHDEGGAA